MKFAAELDSAQAREAIARAPDVMARHLSLKLDRAAEEVAREMQDAAPKAFSNLANSIHIERESDLARFIAPGVNYARYVEDGTPPGTMPPPDSLRDWIKQKSFTERAGIYGPRKPRRFNREKHGDELRDRSFALALYIKAHGTRAQPFVAPTASSMGGRVLALLREGVDSGVKEILA